MKINPPDLSLENLTGAFLLKSKPSQCLNATVNDYSEPEIKSNKTLVKLQRKKSLILKWKLLE